MSKAIKTIAMVAGEASGDLLGSHLMEAIKQVMPEVRVVVPDENVLRDLLPNCHVRAERTVQRTRGIINRVEITALDAAQLDHDVASRLDRLGRFARV